MTTRAERQGLHLPRRFKLIGLGGVGSIAARYLALFLASLDEDLTFVLVDGDAFEEENAGRMFFSEPRNKAAVVCDELVALLGDSRLLLDAKETYVTPANVAELILPGDLVLLAVDNHDTRKLVSERCGQLDDVTLVSGGNDGVEPEAERPKLGTYGNVQVHVRRNGVDLSPPLTAHHPEIADPKDENPGTLSCAEQVASVAQILFTNLQTATAMLNTLRLHLAEELAYSELHFDVHHGRMQPAGLPAPDYAAAKDEEHAAKYGAGDAS